MWWLLLIALGGGEYKAEIIVKSQAQCEQIKLRREDMCVPVEMTMLKDISPKRVLQ